MLAYLDVPLSWSELLKRTARETGDDNGLGLAAQLAYYFFLALFPALLFLISLVSFVASPDLIRQTLETLGGVAPPAVVEIVRDQLATIAQSRSGGLMTFGVLAAFWSSSAALVGLIDALNRAYDVEDARPWWKQRLIALLLTLGLATFVIASITLVVAGPEIAQWVARQVGFGSAFAVAWMIVQWPLVFVLIATAVGLIYYFAPDVEQDLVWLTPGSILATALWIAASLGLRLYVVNFGSYNETYGAIGGVMVLLLWLYLTGLVIVIGAELNSEIEHASPQGKDAGEKVPGQRRSIGPRAAREFRARQQRASSSGAAVAADAGAVAAPLHRHSAEERTVMTTHDSHADQSIADLLKTAIRDVQLLIQSELALAKAEIRQEGRRLGVGIGLVAGAVLAALLALVFLLTTLAWGLASALAWPVWLGFAVVTAVMLVAAGVLAMIGRRKLAAGRHLPKTVDTMKEHAEWIRTRTS